jgi:hypothetical protein
MRIGNGNKGQGGRWRISSAHVVALLALFLAFGGGAYAAKVKLKANSVKTKTIKNGAVTTSKLADGAVSGAKIADGAVGPAKIAAPISYQALGGFANGWSPGTRAEIGIDAFGVVHLRGDIGGGTFGMTAFVIPPQFRPATPLSFAAVSGGATVSVNRISIPADGLVFLTGTMNAQVSLDGITYSIP